MPNEKAMTHVSRPFQVGLAAVAVLAAVWLVALRGHASPSGSTPSAAPQQAPQSSAPAPASSSPYTGSAPGVAGLTRAIEKARGAVALSERNAHQLQRQSDLASGSTDASGTPAGTAPTRRTPATASSHSASATATQRSIAATSSASKRAASHAKATKTATPRATHHRPALAGSYTTPVMQPRVEAQLKAGKVVAILFWNPHGEVDQLVRAELQAAQRALHGQLAVEVAEASQAGAFGSFTRAVQVLATPTILLVNGRGQTSSLTGLTDSFSLQQAISEARG
jgi:hypothetical protein